MGHTHTLVVGGTRGIGRALVKVLGGSDPVISVIGRRPPIEADRDLPGVRYWEADLLDADGVKVVLKEIVRQQGKINHLVFFQKYRGKGDHWTGHIDTTLTGTRDVIEALTNQFSEGSQNSIVIVSSIASVYVADEQPLSYHVAKAGLNQMVRYYAVTLGTKGIRVNSVSLGTVLKEESKHFYLENKPLHELYKRITPLGRMGTAEEVAQTIVFLCSSKASFITGQNLVVDGGLSLRGHETLARQLSNPDQSNITQQMNASLPS